jgi:hypothetical protein
MVDSSLGSNTQAGNFFGSCVALSADGTTLAVGAQYEGSISCCINGSQTQQAGSKVGAIYIFSFIGGTWMQTSYIKASNAGPNNFFGTSCSLSADGSTLAVGAYGEGSIGVGVNGLQTQTVAAAGAVYVFARSSGSLTWVQEAYVKASNTAASNNFGFALDLTADGSVLLVGASHENGAGAGLGTVIQDQSTGQALQSGAAYLFRRTGTTWTQILYIKASNAQAGNQFGVAVCISADGGTLAIGAATENGIGAGVNADPTQSATAAAASGAVYVFVQAGTAYAQQAYIKAQIVAPGFLFGTSVTLNADGAILVVGAIGDGRYKNCLTFFSDSI